MSVVADELRRHALLVCAQQLPRTRGRLRALPPGERRAVVALAEAVAEGVVELLLAQAARDPALRAALSTVYGSGAPSADRRAVAN